MGSAVFGVIHLNVNEMLSKKLNIGEERKYKVLLSSVIKCTMYY